MKMPTESGLQIAKVQFDQAQENEQEPSPASMLFKVGEPEHMQEFANGTLYCNSLRYFTDPSNAAKLCFDANEELIGVYQREHIRELRIASSGREPIVIGASSLAAPIRIGRKNDVRLFCMYAVHPGPWREVFDERKLPSFLNYITIKTRIVGFGLSVALVIDIPAFVKRVRAAADALDIHNSGGLVRYVDLKGTSGMFPERQLGRIKDKAYEDEREYRFIFSKPEGLDEPLRLNVGSLRDIVKVVTWTNFSRGARFRFPGEFYLRYLVRPKRFPRKLKKRLKRHDSA